MSLRAIARDVAVWTVEDMLRFREVADQDEWAAGWRLTLSGLRRSEVLGLRWASVDLSAGLVRVEAGRVAPGQGVHIDDGDREALIDCEVRRAAVLPPGGAAARHDQPALAALAPSSRTTSTRRSRSAAVVRQLLIAGRRAARPP
jgi:hypothetical protein